MLRERRRHAHYKLNTRLDRKSSRGMIYENEELRLRTININAEVERGQTDIKRLRKENDQLRREIWSLRDEYDRLNKKFKTKFVEPNHGAQNTRCSQVGCSCQGNDGSGGGWDEAHIKCNSEESDSCDSCCCHDEDDISCNEDCCNVTKTMVDSSELLQQTADNLSPAEYTKATTDETGINHPPGPSILTNFDHLSVVSEETLSNSDVLAHQTEHLLGYTPDISGSQTTLPSLVGPITPLTPIELVANELNDLQAVVPPLSYFENILQQHMSSNLSSTPGTSSSNSTGKTVIRHTNGWDYNLQSPFTQKRYPANSISPLMNQRSTQQTLTTFVPTTTVTPPLESVTANDRLLVEKTIITCHDMSVIETVPITTMTVKGCMTQPTSSSNTHTTANNLMTSNDNINLNGNARPKHFFAPMKPKLKLNTALANQKRLPPPPPPVAPTVPVQQITTNTTSTTLTNGLLGVQQKCEPPDIYVTNALATPYKHPTMAADQPPPIPQRITSTATSAQTDSANLESILNDIEAISEDILAIQLEKTKCREKVENKSNKSISKSNETLQENGKNTKPYRSEMNLLLTYDGDNPTIKQAVPTGDENQVLCHILNQESTNGATRRAKSLEREHTDSPSPNIPDPMQPFPDNRKYIGFERFNKANVASTSPCVAVTATQTSPVLNNSLSNRPHLPLSPLVTSVNMPNQASGKAQPPVPPARSYPSPLNIKCMGIQRSSSVSYKANTCQSPMGSPVLSGIHPNKSHLFSVIANAAARRAQFRSQPTSMTKSLDTPQVEDNAIENGIQSARNTESSDNVRRKDRRVSIACADTDSPGSPDKPITSIRTLHAQNTTTASCSDLPAVMPNPSLRNLKQTSHSTPNSPHSSRKHEGSPLNTPVPPIVSITPATPHLGRSSHGNGSQHHQAHSNSYPSAVASTIQQQRKNSQDTIKASAAEIACAAANAVRSKCSRRHSDGTVSHTNQRSSGASGGTNGGHHHTHHNHHHHQHSSSLVSATNPHHSHHSRQDSNHETVASYSDRNSNSLASSRESSASFSMRSTRRKLSVSSHTGGKIPWCGCWGNGCL